MCKNNSFLFKILCLILKKFISRVKFFLFHQNKKLEAAVIPFLNQIFMLYVSLNLRFLSQNNFTLFILSLRYLKPNSLHASQNQTSFNRGFGFSPSPKMEN